MYLYVRATESSGSEGVWATFCDNFDTRHQLTWHAYMLFIRDITVSVKTQDHEHWLLACCCIVMVDRHILVFLTCLIPVSNSYQFDIALTLIKWTSSNSWTSIKCVINSVKVVTALRVAVVLGILLLVKLLTSSNKHKNLNLPLALCTSWAWLLALWYIILVALIHIHNCGWSWVQWAVTSWSFDRTTTTGIIHETH